MKNIELSSALRAQILASCVAGTFYVPASGGGVTVDPEFQATVKNKTVEVELLEVGEPQKSGRTGSNGYATNQDVFKSVCRIKHGTLETGIKLNFVDVVTLMAKGGKGTIYFGTYTPDGQKVGEEKTYLVPVASGRVSATDVAEYIEANITVA